MHAVLKHWHPMLGIDLHIPWPPGSPSPAPTAAPYRTGSVMMGTGLTASVARSHCTMGFGWTMQRGTDIGPLIPHVGAPSQTLAVEMLFSASKSHYGASAHPVEGKPMAVALFGNVNPNLNCGIPIPTPTGFALAINTHYVGMSEADVMVGNALMMTDLVLQAVFQYVGGRAAGWITRRLAPRVMSRTAARQAVRAMNRSRPPGAPKLGIGDGQRALQAAQRRRASRYAGVVTRGIGDGAVGGVLGGPMGADLGTAGVPTPGGVASEHAERAVRDYYESPAVEEHSPGGPGSAPSDAGGGEVAGEGPGGDADAGHGGASGSSGEMGMPDGGAGDGADAGVCEPDHPW